MSNPSQDSDVTQSLQRAEHRNDERLRVGVFTNALAAEQALRGLLAVGFEAKQLSVLCSDEAVTHHFHKYDHQRPAGTFTPSAALAGSTLGALLGGGAVIASAIATGGLGLLATGGIAAWGGGVLGGLVGAMLTRGVEKEAANFYDQSLREGNILVIAEAGDHEIRRLQMAEDVFVLAGAKPLALSTG